MVRMEKGTEFKGLKTKRAKRLRGGKTTELQRPHFIRMDCPKILPKVKILTIDKIYSYTGFDLIAKNQKAGKKNMAEN